MPIVLRKPLTIFVGLTLILCARDWMRSADGKLHAWFFDVGQADGALIVTPSGKRIVIDGGRDGALLPQLGRTLPALDPRLDLLVMSHPQLDHMASFPELLRRYEVGAVLMTGVSYPLAKYREFLALLKEKNIPVLYADPRKDLDLGDGIVIDVLWPPPTLAGATVREVNDTSVAVRVVGRGTSILFTGDMGVLEEQSILRSGQEVKSDILKVAHHGSKTSSSPEFLRAVAPSLAVISVAKENGYGHPSPEVVRRFQDFGIPLRITAIGGTVHLSW